MEKIMIQQVRHGLRLGAFALFFLGAACVPKHLQKYQTQSPTDRALAPTEVDPVRVPEKRSEPAQVEASSPIYAISQNSYRLNIPEERVWDALITVLLKDYNLTVVDKDAGLITTEWDSYYLDQKLYRNRLSLRLSKVGRGACDLYIFNNTEYIDEANQISRMSGVWLPAKEDINEGFRVVRNIALLLNQPPPVGPPTAVAKEVEAEASPLEKR
jgi:hypothetical protein